MIFPKVKLKSRRRGTAHPLSAGARCLNKLCQDAFVAGRKNIRKASPYGPLKRLRWLCTSCGKTFSHTRMGHGRYRLRKTKAASVVHRLMASGVSLRHLARIAGVSRSTVARWKKLRVS